MTQAEANVPRHDKSKEKVTDGMGTPGDLQHHPLKKSHVKAISWITQRPQSADDKSTKMKDQAAKSSSTTKNSSRKHSSVGKAKSESTVEATVQVKSRALAAISETDTMNKNAMKNDKKKGKEEGKGDREDRKVDDTSAPQVK